MRNTKDWYLFVDRLLTEQKKLYIYIERKFYTTDDALITGIKAILAEEYSRELSKKINNAHKNRQKQNGPAVLTSNTYGYRKMPDKSVVIVEEEARVKRRMYELCAAGYGSRKIANILKGEGIVGANGNPFTDSAILRMIQNPLNKGTVVMNRLHYDFESKRMMKMPASAQYVYENKVPPIVSEELWELANREIARRAKAVRRGSPKRGRYQGKSGLSGKLFCGLCGNPYYRRIRKRGKDQCVIHEWKCKKYLETGRRECGNIHLEEETLYGLLSKVCEEQYRPDKVRIIERMIRILKGVLVEKDCQPELDRENRMKDKISGQMDMLVEKLLEGVISDEIYRRKQRELEQSLSAVAAGIKRLEQQKAKENGLEDRIVQIEETLKAGQAVEKAIVAGMLEDVEKIWIFPEHMEIVFGLYPISEKENRDTRLKIEYGNLFDYKKKKKDEREEIVGLMRENPGITAGKIARELGLSLSGANYRIRVLKKEGRIRFQGRGGKGMWEILA